MFTDNYERDAVAIVIPMGKNQYMLGNDSNIRIGHRITLLLPSGEIIATSKVQEWRDYGNCLTITTRNHIYYVRRNYRAYTNQVCSDVQGA